MSDVKLAVLQGNPSTEDGLELEVSIVVRDEAGEADVVAQDIIGLIQNYIVENGGQRAPILIIEHTRKKA